ncbi:lytic transglycosylase domain-containing protein [Pectobacterium brasiliense]|uniref:Lytic transglycosylase domain-containing protein n=1 Tax=Pectobacterium brasiliense TaxID=180957 RepID=A0ABS2WZM0_9GAMM|nr:MULTISPECIES: lytic transglycosylase domain-containing protein [Pectobacterium]PLY36707.1 lytic transglycosylase [Pectobacterium carotovorum]MBN3085736.1 lytic transglycosylase domain-containing protein [Pectobacterium brasiliense]MBN3105943.1 lytic transglycosylase domain-containing protein [Pectobacterium brasiliense]MBN3110016.1 lytic transglycosylase domain-containing protein [Pectobacterium brasiliense]MBN3203761.1 lytic transglycosylase domain-containing protein [Pectobacterium brasil
MANRSILISMLIVLGIMHSGIVSAQKRPVALQQIPAAYRQIAKDARVPAESLYSLALTESSRRLPYGERPWPWSINVAGKTYRYETRELAWQALRQFIRQTPLKNIDVGIAQVNLGWNGHRFRSFYDAFEPFTNLRVAARILRECYDAKPGSWLRAAGCYHRPAGGLPAERYMAIVRQKLKLISPVQEPLESSPPILLASSEAIIPSYQLTWIEPE